MKIALGHPGLFSFVGALSAAIDVPRRPFSIRRIQQYRAYRSIFGPWDSAECRSRDPFLIARSLDATEAPYIFLACGEEESLLTANRAFATVLRQRHLQFEFHVVHGGHNWNEWNAQLPRVFERLMGVVGKGT